MSKFIQRDSNFAFTLAEMMVVMLILTIVLAAFAPLMTKRKNVDLSSSPWRYTENNNGDIYYGLGGNQTAMIGQNKKDANDPSSRLLIKTENDGQSYITLKNGEQGVLGGLYWQAADSHLGGTIRLGGPYNTVPTEGGNTAMGQSALASLTSGGNNTAMGSNSLESMTTGAGNVAIGANALMLNQTGDNNVAIGNAAMSLSPTASNNIAIGFGALSFDQTGENNVGIGSNAIHDNRVGDNNVAYGANALTKAIGSSNTAIGHNACQYVTGSNKTCIGASSGPANGANEANSDANIVYIGTANSVVYIPGSLIVGKDAFLNHDSNDARTAIRLQGYETSYIWKLQGDNVNGNPGTVRRYGDGIPTGGLISDKRLKNIKSENKSGLEDLRNLKVYDYTFKKDKEKTPQVGVMAQDLQKVFPNAVKKGDDGFLMIRRDEMFYAMLNSIKQLDTLVQGILNEVKVHLEKITNLANRIKVLEDENKLLKKQLNDLNKRLEKLENDD